MKHMLQISCHSLPFRAVTNPLFEVLEVFTSISSPLAMPPAGPVARFNYGVNIKIPWSRREILQT